MLLRNAAVLSIALLGTPFSISRGDDQQTESLHNNAYQESATSACGAASYCVINFPSTQHKTTVINFVNCSFLVPIGSQVAASYLYSLAKATSPVNVPFFSPISYAGYSSIYINAQVLYFIKQGDSPFFEVATDVGFPLQLSCVISGYHS